MPIANRYYEAVSGWSSSRIETIANSQVYYPITEHGGEIEAQRRFNAGAGHALYTARNFPGSYWNQVAFVADPTGHLVGQFRLEARGSDYVALNERSFLASDDAWSAPIVAEVGPDGALWMIDGYNSIVPRDPTPAGSGTGKANAAEISLRENIHGRIYRVAWNQARPAPRLNLAKATTEQLAATLRSDNQLWRMHAQRLMIERGRRDVVPTLFALARDPGVDEIGLNPAAIHALWTLQGMGQRDPGDLSFQNVVIGALRHPSAGVRRTAATVLPRNPAAATSFLASGVLADPDAQVRLAAFLALAEMPPSDAVGTAIFAAVSDDANAKDRWILDAATAAAARHDSGFLKAALSGGENPSLALGGVIRLVTGHYAQRGPVESIVPTLLALSNASPAVVRPVIDGLSANWPRETVPAFTPEDESKLTSLLISLSDDARSSLLALADRWGRRSIFAAEVAVVARGLREQIGNTTLEEAERTDAARRLVLLADSEEAVIAILAQITPLSTPALAGGYLAALGQSRRSQTGSALIASLNTFTPATRRAAVATLLRRPEWAATLLNSIEKHDLQRADITADHWTQLKAHPDGAIVVKARELDKSNGSASSTEMETLIKKLLPIARQPGDAVHGRDVFAKACAACHTFDGQGAKLGPDLNGIGARPRQDILVDILDPNRRVEASYRVWNVTTKSGNTFNGRLEAETATSVEILETAGEKHIVQRKDIAELIPSAVSMMPTGFEALPEADLAALLEYLATTPTAEKR
jgi:putative heme-binding domain-containing protein